MMRFVVKDRDKFGGFLGVLRCTLGCCSSGFDERVLVKIPSRDKGPYSHVRAISGCIGVDLRGTTQHPP